MEVIKPCPFCGKILDMDDLDTCYPTGIGWEDLPEGIRAYCCFTKVPKNQWCYSIYCQCGCEVHGDSKQEAIDHWNTRV